MARKKRSSHPDSVQGLPPLAGPLFTPLVALLVAWAGMAGVSSAVGPPQPNIINTIAGNGVAGFAGDGGPATAASLNFPGGIAVGNAGDLYIADGSNYRIRKVDLKTGVVTTVAGNGLSTSAGDGGPATAASLAFPVDVFVDQTGNLYIADDGFPARIRKVDTSGTITTVAGGGNTSPADGVQATAADLTFARSVLVDPSGNIYFSESADIWKVNTSGILSRVVGTGISGFSGDGGAATAAQVNFPNGLAMDDAGNLYFADENNNRIRKVDTGGTITTVAGNGTFGFSGDGGDATAAQLGAPFDVAVDGAGNLYIADASNARIRRVGSITTVAGTGSFTFSGDGGPATAAGLGFPFGVFLDALGNLYISGANRIRVVSVPLVGERISVFPAGFNFGRVKINETVSETLSLSNTSATDLLGFSSISLSGPAFSFAVAPSAFTAATLQDTSFIVRFTPTAATAYDDSIQIASNDPKQSLLKVLLMGDGVTDLDVTGKVRYYDADSVRVDSVLMTLTPPGVSVLTDASGQFTFADSLLSGVHTISPSKAGDSLNAVQGADALLILQKTAFLLGTGLTADQLFAGDVNSDGAVDNADAVGILRYLAFFNTNIGQTGAWRFNPDSVLVTGAVTTPDIKAYLIGDVQPSWGRVAASKPVAPPVLVDISEVAWKGERLALPVQAQGEEAVRSLLLSLRYDSAVFRYEGVRLTEMGRDYMLVDNGREKDRVHIALAGVPESGAEGTIFEILFRTREAADEGGPFLDVARLNLERLVVNDIPFPVGDGSALGVRRVPEVFELSQNYPNPFNAQTQIRFALPEQTHVRLTIYNVLGQEVYTLVDEDLAPGYYTLAWDGITRGGAQVASGVYIYRINTSSGFTDIRRMLLLK